MISTVAFPVLWILILDLSLWGTGRGLLRSARVPLGSSWSDRIGFPYLVGLMFASALLFLLGAVHLLTPPFLASIVVLGAALTSIPWVRKRSPNVGCRGVRSIDFASNLLLWGVCFGVFLGLRWIVPPSMMGRLVYPDPEARVFYLLLMVLGFVLFPFVASLWGRTLTDSLLLRIGFSGSTAPHPRFSPRHQSILTVLAAILFHFFLFLYVPRFAHDSLAYHLVIPQTYLLEGGIEPNRNLFFNMPHYWELLYTLPLVGGGTTGVKIFSFQHSVFIFLTLVSMGRGWGGPTLGVLLGFLYLVSPTIQDHLQLVKTENSLGLFVLFTALAFTRWRKSGETRWFILFALMGGWLLGCKYTMWGLSGVFYLAGAGSVLWGRSSINRPRLLLLMTLLWGIPLLPWLVKNALFAGNPVYPNLYGLFGGVYWSETLDSQLRNQYFKFLWEEHDHPLHQFIAVLQAPWELVTAKHLRGRFSFLVIGLLFLAPFFKVSRRGEGSPHLFFALTGFAMWILFPGNESRFLVPMVPLMVLGITPLVRRWTAHPRLGPIVLAVLLLGGFSQLRFPRTLQLESLTPGGYLEILRSTPTTRYALWETVEEEVPENGLVAVFFEEQVYYLGRPYLYHWFGGNMEILRRERTPEGVHRHLAEDLGATHLIVSWRDYRYYLSFEHPSKEQMDWERDLFEDFLERSAVKVRDYEDYTLFELSQGHNLSQR